MNVFLWAILLNFSAFAGTTDLSGLLKEMLKINMPINSCLEELEANTTKAAPDCNDKQFIPLGEGEHRLMRQEQSLNNKGGHRSYETGDYLLRRLPGNRYQALLNLDFRSANPEMARRMQEKTTACLKKLAPFLRGPANETLEVLVLSKEETNRLPQNLPRPNNKIINVLPNEIRGDALNFGENFECLTIGHEILHHLGLCDEYQETASDKADWNCRVVTVTPSYMRDMFYAYNSTVPQTVKCECDKNCENIMSNDSLTKTVFVSMNAHEIVEHNFRGKYCRNDTVQPLLVNTQIKIDDALVFTSPAERQYSFESRRAISPSAYDVIKFTCECPSGDKYCERMIDEIKRRISQKQPRATCPDGLKQLGAAEIGSSVDSKAENGLLILSTPGNGQSLLRRNQFAKTISGSCRGGVPEYEECASFAYMPGNHPACVVPPSCYDDNYFLGN